MPKFGDLSWKYQFFRAYYNPPLVALTKALRWRKGHKIKLYWKGKQMPHYSNGEPAKVGDVVKGIGYNLKNNDNSPKEVIGTVMDVKSGTDTCNITVAVIILRVVTMRWEPGVYDAHVPVVPINRDDGAPDTGSGMAAVPVIEYGQCDHFVKIG